MTDQNTTHVTCSFCGITSDDEACKCIIAGDSAAICYRCVCICIHALADLFQESITRDPVSNDTSEAR